MNQTGSMGAGGRADPRVPLRDLPLSDRWHEGVWSVRVFLGRVLGAVELVRLAVVTRGRFRGPYWQWRLHTAFGRGMPRTRGELVASALDYGVWCRQMRRGA